VTEAVTTNAGPDAVTDGVVSRLRPRPSLRAGVTLAALGVVFGDIGTSPLYGLHTVFSIDHGRVQPTPGDVYGVMSMVFWSVTLIVSIKYVTIVMRADNHGEGGVMALAGLIKRALVRPGPGGAGRRMTTTALLLAVIGASLFYGDSVITPAISVLSAVEGVTVVAPSLHSLVLPISATILVILFAVQRFGTGKVGSLFGPVMLLWFLVLAVGGLREVAQHPDVLRALSPSYAASFVIDHPATTFFAMGAIVLCITGAEALYADMGHFGRPAISRAWFFIVFPALMLEYLGQSALILRQPSAISNPFFLLLPGWSRIPMVVLATAATVIASQAVISGAFSVSRQASQLGLLPPLTVRQTSRESAGQVFLPVVNIALFVGVLTVMLVFGSSAKLATAYGVSVTGALLVDTVLTMIVARLCWRWPLWRVALLAIFFGIIELLFFAANISKVAHGGWLPLLIAGLVFLLMSTWRRGRDAVTANRVEREGSLGDFVEHVHNNEFVRVPGTAVFPHPTKETAPLALRANVEHNGVLHAHVVIFSAEPLSIPHVEAEDQITIDDLGYAADGIVHITLRYGFFDRPDIPRALTAHRDELTEGSFDENTASYFLSRATLRATHAPTMQYWRKLLFVAMARNAANPSIYFGLPDDQTVIMGTQIEF
jgi:KUP system potassium uptake protein